MTGEPLSGIRRLLLTGHERLSDRGRERMQAGLAAGDPHDEVWYAHVVREQLRAVYRANDIDAARVALSEVSTPPPAPLMPECDRLARAQDPRVNEPGGVDDRECPRPRPPREALVIR